MNHIYLHHVDGWVHMHCLSKEGMVPGFSGGSSLCRSTFKPTGLTGRAALGVLNSHCSQDLEADHNPVLLTMLWECLTKTDISVCVPCPDESLSTRLDVSLPALCGCHGEARAPTIKSHLPLAWPPTAGPPSRQPWLIAPREWQRGGRREKGRALEEGQKRGGGGEGNKRGWKGWGRRKGRRRRERDTSRCPLVYSGV